MYIYTFFFLYFFSLTIFFYIFLLILYYYCYIIHIHTHAHVRIAIRKQVQCIRYAPLPYTPSNVHACAMYTCLFPSNICIVTHIRTSYIYVNMYTLAFFEWVAGGGELLSLYLCLIIIIIMIYSFVIVYDTYREE